MAATKKGRQSSKLAREQSYRCNRTSATRSTRDKMGFWFNFSRLQWCKDFGERHRLTFFV